MKWSRLQNIVILVLVVVNVFLLTLVTTREVRSARLEREARTAAAAVLEQNGIAVDEDALPDNMTLQPCRVERDRTAERALAEALLGEVTEEARGGGVFRYAGAGGKGSVQFHSGGNLSAAFSEEAYPLGGQSLEEHAAALMASLQLEGTVCAVEGMGGTGSVTVRQSWQGVPVYTCTMLLKYEDGALRSITEGQWLLGASVPEPVGAALDVPTALIRFLNGCNELGDVCSSVERMEAGYVMTANLSGQARLTPVWQFEAETGAYQMDAVTGVFTRADVLPGI